MCNVMRDLVSGHEWRWLIIMSVILIAIFSVPTIVGELRSSPESQFGGFVFGIEDAVSYIAKMRYGVRDGWQFELMYTPEQHDGGYVYLNYLTLGKLTALVSGEGRNVSTQTLVTSYHIFRVVAGVGLLIVTYLFISYFVAEQDQRRFVWLIVIAGGGLGWLVIMTSGGPIKPEDLPVELYVPEAFTSLMLMGLPHLVLARALMLAGWLGLLMACDYDDWRLALLSGILWLLMGFNQPFSIALVGVLIAIWLGGISLFNKRAALKELLFSIIAGLLPAFYLLYNTLLFTTNSMFAKWASQNSLPSPAPIHYLLAFGVLIALALFGAQRLLKISLDRKSWLLILWPTVASILIYLPINVQRRLLEGAVIPLTILAATGLWWMADKARWSASTFRMVRMGLIGILMLSSLTAVVGGTLNAMRTDWPIAHPRAELEALRWLADHAPDDSIVMATHSSGNILPAYANVRVFVGHGPETVNSKQKDSETLSFFGDGMTDQERTDLIDQYRISYIWIGRPEHEIACSGANCFDPQALGLHKVFDNADYLIYEVIK